MTEKRYSGSIISTIPVEPDGNFQDSSAPGVWSLEEAYEYVKAGTWPTAGVENVDPYINQTTLLLHGDGTQGGQNNTFLDESSNAFAITRNGDVTQGSFSPFGDRWSVYFNGAGGASGELSYSSANLNIYSGNFTVELWHYISEAQAYSVPLFVTSDSGTYYAIGLVWDNSGNLTYTSSATGSSWARLFDLVVASSNIVYDRWVHIAMTYDGTNVRVYYDGSLAYTSPTVTGFKSDSAFYLGAYNEHYKGYISDFRVVSGSVLYTGSTITVPTEPLTAVSGTQLLVAAYNNFNDRSANALTPTAVYSGNSVTKFSPYANSGTYVPAPPDINAVAFDGDDAIYGATTSGTTITGSTDFCLEAWIYPQNISAVNGGILQAGTSSGALYLRHLTTGVLGVGASAVGVDLETTATIAQNEWQHVAVSRSGSTLRIFINGAVAASTTSSTDYADITASDQLMVGARYYFSAIQDEFYGYISNARMVFGDAVYTAAFTPPTSPLTAIAGTELLTCQDGFVDNSTNGFTITTNGNPQLTEFGPFGAGDGYWSNGFDGAGDYLATPSDADFGFGTGDFTIEGWAFTPDNTRSVNAASQRIVDIGGGDVGVWLQSSTGYISYNAGNVTASSTVFPENQWNHFALTRSGSSLKLFLNGSEVASATNSNDLGSAHIATVGAFNNSSDGAFLGQISNARIVKGTALYTSNFTPPTTPLTAATGTSLLTCQSNRFVDNSSNAFAITVGGDPEVLAANPFDDNIPEELGSGDFYGYSDYLTTPASSEFELTGDFTVELWYYRLNNDTNEQGILGLQPTAGTSGLRITDYNDGRLWCILISGSATTHLSLLSDNADTLVAGAWNHIAFTRSGSDCRTFVNGVLDKSGTSSSWTGTSINALVGAARNYSSGAIIDANAFISSVRVVNGAALYTAAFTPPAQPPTPVPNTSLLLNFDNAAIFDSRSMNDLWTIGNAQIDTSVVKYGTGSLKFDGSGDYIAIRANEEMDLGTGDFTIEMWANPSAQTNDYPSLIACAASWTTGAFYIRYDSLLGNADSFGVFWNPDDPLITANTTSATGTWHHVAVVRNGTSMVLYVNGTNVGSATISSTRTLNLGLGGALWIGNNGSANTYYNGYIDDLRITKGVARYTSNFTPPTRALPDT